MNQRVVIMETTIEQVMQTNMVNYLIVHELNNSSILLS
jgi:hypothetical protein